jgi:hypothetical protein
MNESPQYSRYGFYYYPDTIHYRENDLHRWIPELKALGASWLTLLAPLDRAIPETFILQLLYEGIQPVIHLPIQPEDGINLTELSMIFEAYAHWGVRYIALFDRPNMKKNWSPSSWVQRSLVDRFLDIFIPVARAAMQSGLAPSFPALEPGGDYWDTAFLFSALLGLSRRGEAELIDEMVLSAYAWPGNRSPNWGAGGPERWPQSRPYATPANSEDQCGFHIFDWYLAVSQAALGKNMPVIMLAAGSRLGDQQDPRSPAVDIQAHSWQNLALVRSMTGQAEEYDPIPPEVLACNFWLLAAEQGSPELPDAWFKPNGEQLPVVTMIKEWVASGGADPSSASKQRVAAKLVSPESRPIAHYLLLPTFEWGPADWKLDAIRPFINKYQPTIGFSPVEASHARRVTVVGGASKVPEAIIDGLLAAGCIVEQISGDGMNIATDTASAK